MAGLGYLSKRLLIPTNFRYVTAIKELIPFREPDDAPASGYYTYINRYTATRNYFKSMELTSNVFLQSTP